MRVRTAICSASLVLLCAAGLAARQDAPIVYTVEVDGIIQPVIAEYLKAALDKADAAGAALMVITLRTPGGLLDTTRDINSAIIAARTPVAVFVGPSGKRAASAGFLIAMAEMEQLLDELATSHDKRPPGCESFDEFLERYKSAARYQPTNEDSQLDPGWKTETLKRARALVSLGNQWREKPTVRSGRIPKPECDFRISPKQ